MPSYKLSETAEADLIRIYHWGFERYGQVQADQYFGALFATARILFVGWISLRIHRKYIRLSGGLNRY